jgi:hypothetical protein
MTNKLEQIYLATPYSQKDAAVRERRCTLAKQAVIALSRIYPKKFIFSPIVYWHAFAVELSLGTSFADFEVVDTISLMVSAQMWILQIDGWNTSSGIKKEVVLAHNFEKRVRFISPKFCGIPRS